MSRLELLMKHFDSSGFGLEIGPGFNPLLPKSQGYHVETLDHMTADGLREKYRDNVYVDISKIEEVNYVSNGGSIFDLIGEKHRYDFIVAAHVIEHTTDMLGFLLDCENLLKNAGVLILVVPDKRYCFDVLRPTSTTGAILQAHLERRQNHNPGTVFDEIAYNSLRGGVPAWTESNSEPLAFFQTLEKAKQVFEEVQQTGAFVDIHAWQFTPSSFRLIINDLNQMGYLSLREKFFHDTINFEFYIILSTTGAGCPVDRQSLAHAIVKEGSTIPG